MLLVREYLRKILYESEKGYFSKAVPPIIFNESGKVDFTKLRNQKEWLIVQQDMFASKEGGEWLTQCELFAPHFSNMLVDWAVNLKPGAVSGLNVIEIGGGSGTNACNFLNALRTRHPELYSQSTYTICEISSTMSHLQRKRIREQGHKEDVFNIENVDFLQWDKVVSKPTIVLAMEVLDNLPHDKLTFKGSGEIPDTLNVNEWDEVLVDSWGVEQRRELADELAIEAGKYFLRNNESVMPTKSIFQRLWNDFGKEVALRSRRRVEAGAKSVFVPSGAMQLLHTLDTYFPQHILLAGDFSYLPFGDVIPSSQNMKVPGSLFKCRNAPIVSGNDAATGQRVDYPSYVIPGASFDVFFQTDFDRLGVAYKDITGGEAKIFSTKEFVEKNARDEDKQATTTMSGYNPMIEDFENVSFMVAKRNYA